MEQKLRSLSKKEYDKYLDEAYRYVKTTFTSRTKKFDGKYCAVHIQFYLVWQVQFYTVTRALGGMNGIVCKLLHNHN